MCDPGAMRLGLLFLAVSVTGPAGAAPAVYDLDPEHSFVHFEVLHFDSATMRGRIGPIAGAVRLDPQAGSSHVGLTIDAARVDKGFRPLDSRLRPALGGRPRPPAHPGRGRAPLNDRAVRGAIGDRTPAPIIFGRFEQPLLARPSRHHPKRNP